MQPLRNNIAAMRADAAPNTALSIPNLAVRFGARTILDSINLNVREGEFLCIVVLRDLGRRRCFAFWQGWQSGRRRSLFRRHRDLGAVARSRDHFPGLFQSPAAMAHRARQRCAQSGSSQCAERRAECRYRQAAQEDGLEPDARTISRSALGRHAAESADCALPGTGAEAPADGRAVRRARRA